MLKLVLHGASLQCSCGTSPSTLVASVGPSLTSDQLSIATVQDFVPMVNIPPFGMCTTPANPQVGAATAAAQGVLTPQPCIPVVSVPWSPGSAVVEVNGVKGLSSDSRTVCQWSGSISIISPVGQVDID